MFFDRLRYELKFLGLRAILPPVLVLAGFAILATVFALISNNPASSTAHLLGSSLEMFLPIAVGTTVTLVCIRDPALELQLTFPRSYASTAIKRLTIIIGWTACLALINSLLLSLFKLNSWPTQFQHWPIFTQYLLAQLIWCAPLLWFAGLGLCLALLTRSFVASTAVLGGIWIIEVLFLKNLLPGNAWLQSVLLFPTTLLPEATFWLSSRITVLITAAIMLILSWFLLHRTESLLKGSSEE